MAVVLGLNAKAYVSSTYDGTYTEITNIRDVTVNLEKSEADITTRGGGGFRQSVGTLKDGSVEFQMVWDTADANFTTFRTAFFGDDTVYCKFLDGASGQGLHAAFSIVNFTRTEALEEALMVDVSLKVTKDTDLSPTWVTS